MECKCNKNTRAHVPYQYEGQSAEKEIKSLRYTLLSDPMFWGSRNLIAFWKNMFHLPAYLRWRKCDATKGPLFSPHLSCTPRIMWLLKFLRLMIYVFLLIIVFFLIPISRWCSETSSSSLFYFVYVFIYLFIWQYYNRHTHKTCSFLIHDNILLHDSTLMNVDLLIKIFYRTITFLKICVII